MSVPKQIASVHHNISNIDSADWNLCANGSSAIYNPFVDHRFLEALEISGSVCAETGWQPFHLVVRESGAILGAMPMYLKSHSRGEFVFDGEWAEAWYRAGGEYYPKLQVSVPFTPVTGSRLLVAAKHRTDVEARLMQTAIRVAHQINVSSLHITFIPEQQWKLAGQMGMLQRIDSQFRWSNASYETFDDFLLNLSSKKRKNIRRERRDALINGIAIDWVTGSDLTEAHWDAFYECYSDTGYRKFGIPYLNRSFFSLIGEKMPNQVLLILCRRNSRYIAGAINFIGGDTLFGRNWGCIEDHRFLHFEICYYQAIDFAIQHRLKFVEAGAQGAHKIARGYMPRQTYSVHWIRDVSLRHAVEEYLSREKNYVEQDIEYIEAHTPFRRDIDLKWYRNTFKEA